MRRLILPRRKLLLGAGAALITSPAIIRGAMAQVPMTGAGLGKPASGGGTFSYIAGVSTVTGVSGGASGAIDTTGAGLLIASVFAYAAVSGLSISDSKSNSWTPLTASGTNVYCNVYYSVPTSVGASHTVTVTGTNYYGGVIFAAFSGGAASPFDQQSGNEATSGGGSVTASSITPSVNNELVIASIASDTPGVTATVNGGFTIIDNYEAGVGGVNVGGAAAYLIQTSAAAAGPTWTTSGGVWWAMKMSSYKVS